MCVIEAYGLTCGEPAQLLTAIMIGLESSLQFVNASGNSSVGRAQPCQGWGREFESRFPLQFPAGMSARRRRCLRLSGLGGMAAGAECAMAHSSRAEWQSGHAAACKAVYLGSIPGSASSSLTVFNPKSIQPAYCGLPDSL